MLPKVRRHGRCAFVCATLLALASIAANAQESAGPQAIAPPPVPPAKQSEHTANGQKIIVPAGTRLAVTLENGISTNSAKAGDSVYFHTSFPVTQNNHVVIPVGSYIRGSLLESKRPGHIKGKGE
jgi:hypothetical protein